MRLKSEIPTFTQSSKAVSGIHVLKIPVDDITYHSSKMHIHRDDFYIFFILTSGAVKVQCDIDEIALDAIGIALIKPFQIHAVKEISQDAEGYFISIAPFLLPDSCIEIFQNLEISEQAKILDPIIADDILTLIYLLHGAFNKKELNRAQIINGFFISLIYTFSNLFDVPAKGINHYKNQAGLISANFKKLILQDGYRESPSFFAAKLNISTSHLNDCVNTITGKSVTYWLQQAMIIEAQRLLYYTDNDVKEIAYSMGFEDQSYFSRLFKKITLETPLSFRKKFRE